MTDRLNSGDKKPTKRTAQEWCDHGNAYLRGERPAEHGKPGIIGEYIKTPRNDVHWVVRNGQAVIEFKTQPVVSQR